MSLFDMSSITEALTESMITGGNDPDFPGVITGGCDTSGMFPEQEIFPDGPGGRLKELLADGGDGDRKADTKLQEMMAVKDDGPGFGPLFNDNPAFID